MNKIGQQFAQWQPASDHLTIDTLDCHFGAIFIHNEGYSSMCGHAVIALTKFAVEAVRQLDYAGYSAVIPRVTGSALSAVKINGLLIPLIH
ncbi:MAG: proline racemase [Enterobacterales bacterium]|jgi:proline racemase